MACAAPFHSTTAAETNRVPLTVKVKAPLPSIVLLGEIVVTVGTGLGCGFTLNARAGEVPPPGAGLVTVTCAVEAA